MPDRIRTIVQGVTAAFGADYSFDYEWGYPALKNNKQMLEIVRRAGQVVVGRERVLQIDTPAMGGEDFVCYTAHVPGACFFLGVQPSDREVYPLHNPRFDFDDSVLATGAAVLAGCVVQAQEVLGKEAAE